MKKVAIITGGNRGLGKAIIDLLLMEKEIKIISVSRSLHVEHEDNSNIEFIRTDLSEPFDSAIFLKINIYVDNETNIYFFNNASIILPINYVGSFSSSEIETSQNVNIKYPINFINYLMSIYEKNSLNIINISSGVATKPMAYWSLYSASKAYMHSFLMALRQERVNDNNLNIYNIDPGVLDTHMQEEIRNHRFPANDYFVSLKDDGKLKTAEQAAIEIFKVINFHA